MKFKFYGKCFVDISLIRGDKHYVLSLDLADWHLVKTDNDKETGYSWLHILCFRIGVVHTPTFNAWLNGSLGSLLTGKVQQTSSSKVHREDVM